ncbi:MAG: site-2 protease family protein, partial [Phycisphaeraceae bacterium]
GVKASPAIVGEVMPGSPAAEAVAVNASHMVGLLPGDQLLTIDGKKPSDFSELQLGAALTGPNDELNLRVLRPAFGDRKEQVLEFSIAPKFSKLQKLMQIGVERPQSLAIMDDEDPAARAKAVANWEKNGVSVRPGWVLKQVNGQAVDAGWQYELLVGQSGGKPMDLTFVDPRQNNAEHHVTITPVGQWQTAAVNTTASDDAEQVIHLLGLVPAVSVANVVKGSPAQGKLETGDVIAKAGDYDWPTVAQIQSATRKASPSLAFTVLRGDKRVTLNITPRKTGLLFGAKLVGIGLGWGDGPMVIGRVLDDSPLSGLKNELAAGSTIAAVNGQPIKTWTDLRQAISNAGEKMELTVSRPVLGGIDRRIAVTVTDEMRQKLKALAWMNPILVFDEAKVLQKVSSPVEAVKIGFDKTWMFLKQVYVTLLRLADRSLPSSQLSGPLGIVTLGTQMAGRGIAYLFYFAGLISVNLAVVNFLPFPIVDGGLFVMLLIEKARGKPLPLGVQTAITYAGLVFLGAVFLFVTYNDIVRMVGG